MRHEAKLSGGAVSKCLGMCYRDAFLHLTIKKKTVIQWRRTNALWYSKLHKIVPEFVRLRE